MDLATGLEKGFILLEFEGQSYKIWVKLKNKYILIIITSFFHFQILRGYYQHKHRANYLFSMSTYL